VSVLKQKDLNPRILEKLITDPAYFSEKLLGLVLHWYQKLVIRDPHPSKVMCWSRQIGKSTMVAVYVVWYIFTHKKKKILILSQDRDASRRFYDLVIDFILSSPILTRSIVGEPLQSRTRFSNGTVMFNKAPGRTGKSVRGDAIDLLIIDEADFIEEEVFDAAEQTTASTDGEIILISTPYKKGSTFHQYFTDGWDARQKFDGVVPLEQDEEPYTEPVGRKFFFKAYHFDYKTGLSVFKPDGKPQLSQIKVDRMRAKREYWKFQQEYEAIWADDIASYFHPQLIKDAVDESYSMQEYGQPNKIYYLGADFAKHIDATVIMIGEMQEDGRIKIVYIYEARGRNWTAQAQDLMNIGNKFNIKKAFLDGTGVGDAMFDMVNGVGSPLYQRCQRVIMQTVLKNNIYQNATQLFGAGRIIIPHHKQLIDELMFVQYEKMDASEYVKIHAPKGMTGINDDYPDAMCLMLMGMSQPSWGTFTGYRVVTKTINPYPNFWDGKIVDNRTRSKGKDSTFWTMGKKTTLSSNQPVNPYSNALFGNVKGRRRNRYRDMFR